MEKLKKEFPYVSIALLPFIYLAIIWNKLPQKVPMHMNMNGEVDRWGNRLELIFMLCIISGLTYIIFLFLPKIDPKQKLQNMGKKFDSLRLILTFFMSVLGIYILYTIQNQTSNINSKPDLFFPLIGLLFAFLGNYMKTVKPNYFIGIRTPWTLENEEVWRKTHLLGGKLWFIGGLLMTLTYFLEPKLQFNVFIGITAVISIIPMVFSYLEFKKQL